LAVNTVRCDVVGGEKIGVVVSREKRRIEVGLLNVLKIERPRFNVE
jgi:hypothetical protein